MYLKTYIMTIITIAIEFLSISPIVITIIVIAIWIIKLLDRKDAFKRKGYNNGESDN